MSNDAKKALVPPGLGRRLWKGPPFTARNTGTARNTRDSDLLARGGRGELVALKPMTQIAQPRRGRSQLIRIRDAL